MPAILNGEKLDINPDKSVSDLVKETKELCREEGEILVEIKVNGSSLSQSEWEELAKEKIDEKDIGLSSESAEYISGEIISRAKEYLADLSDWINDVKDLDEKTIDDLKEIPESLLWLNLAIEQLTTVHDKKETLGGEKINKLLNENNKFISELKEALNDPEGNRQLIKNLIFRKLPKHLENYRFFYDSLEKQTRRID